MDISFDPRKRRATLDERGLDMAEAAEVFESEIVTLDDDRKAYGERRHITVGFVCGRMVVLVWTLRGRSRRIISMRKANEREQHLYSG